LALAIIKEEMQISLPGTMGNPVFTGADVTKLIKAHKTISPCPGTDPAAKDVITTYPYYRSETIQDTLKMMNGYLTKDCMDVKQELKDTFRHADCLLYVYTMSNLERLCREQLESGIVGVKAFILTYDNVSCIMLRTGALAEYSQVEIFLGAHPRDVRAKALMKVELEPRDPSTFAHDQLQKHVLDKWAMADALAVGDSETVHTAAGVSPYIIPAGVRRPQMPVVVNLPAIPNDETLAPS
jgi:hypothetical protein